MQGKQAASTGARMEPQELLTALFGPFLNQYWWIIPILIGVPVLKLFAPIIKGRAGEGVVNLTARLRLDSAVYHLLKDVTIPAQNGTTQIDHIVVSIYGLFVIETKNYKGWIFADVKSRQWTQVNFKQKHRFQNPLHQNYGHICALSDLLDIPKEKIHGVVCFIGDAKFKTDVPAGVFIQGRYIGHIKSFQTPILSNDEVEELIRRIESERLERGRKTNKKHVQQLRSQKTEAREQKSDSDRAPSSASKSSCQNSCPKCGAEMVLRTVKRGPNAGHRFWGCSTYPKCRSSQPVAE
jgi:hypothetical protein